MCTVWTDKHRGNSSWLQFGRSSGTFGLKILPAKMLTAQVRVWGGDPVDAGTLYLLLPFAKFQRVLWKFKQCHIIFCCFATSVGHTGLRHAVLCLSNPACLVGSTTNSFPLHLGCFAKSANDNHGFCYK